MLGFISLGGLGLAIHVLRQKFAPEPDGDTSGDFTYDRNLLGSADEMGAERAVRDFLAADGVAKKLEFVRLPRRVQPLMEEYYRTRSAAPATAGEVTDREKVRSGDTWLVMLEMLVNDADPFDRSLNTPRKRNFAVEEIESHGSYLYKVDWEIAVAWEEMPLEEFRRDMPRTAVPFRVVMRESDYYNHGFLDRSRWLAADLYYPGRREFQFTGYIELGTKEGDELRSMIAGGRRTGAVLALRYPPEAVSRDQVVIERLVHDSWYVKQDVPPGQESSAIPSDGAKNGSRHPDLVLPLPASLFSSFLFPLQFPSCPRPRPSSPILSPGPPAGCSRTASNRTRSSPPRGRSRTKTWPDCRTSNRVREALRLVLTGDSLKEAGRRCHVAPSVIAEWRQRYLDLIDAGRSAAGGRPFEEAGRVKDADLIHIPQQARELFAENWERLLEHTRANPRRFIRVRCGSSLRPRC